MVGTPPSQGIKDKLDTGWAQAGRKAGHETAVMDMTALPSINSIPLEGKRLTIS